MCLKYNSIEIKKEKLYLNLYVYIHRHTHTQIHKCLYKKARQAYNEFMLSIKRKNNPNLFSVKRQIELVD